MDLLYKHFINLNSAGVGRTGTFISLDYLQEQAKQTKMVDIMGCVYELRRQRVSMVQKVVCTFISYPMHIVVLLIYCQMHI